MLRLITSILLLFTVSSVHAAIYCGKEGVPVGGHIGIPTEYTPRYYKSFANPPIYKLDRVQIAWLPYDEEMRYRYQEVVDVDWQNQTISQVDLYDGSLPGIVETDTKEAELRGSSSFPLVI
jgi:hypothetical protein